MTAASGDEAAAILDALEACLQRLDGIDATHAAARVDHAIDLLCRQFDMERNRSESD